MTSSPGDAAGRERTVDILCQAFADDILTLEEFERRVEVAHAARSDDELRGLLDDLPGRVVRKASAPGEGGVTGSDAAGPDADSGRTTPAPVRVADPAGVRESAFLGGILGGGSIAGAWTPARRTLVVGLLGGYQLDLRDATLAPGTTEVVVLAVLGGVEVLVPPGVRVEVSGLGVLGGFEHTQTTPSTERADAPVVRITGFACLGGAEVVVRHPGESKREARKRSRAERKLSRERRQGRLRPGPDE